MPRKSKPIYAPLPARAMLDNRLKERHLRTLAVVAAHDRLGRNGIGCYASHKRLAAMIGCSYQRLSQNLTELGRWGYIERHTHPLNKRLRVYRVLYNDDDDGAMKGVQNDASPSREQCSPDSSPEGEGSSPYSSPEKSAYLLADNPESHANIFRETVNRSCGNKEKHSSEDAPPYGAASSAGGKGDELQQRAGRILRLVQQALKLNEPQDWASIQEGLQQVRDEPDLHDDLHAWACRLIDDVELRMSH